MAEYRDPTPISPKEPEYDKSKVSKEVANYTQQVREKRKGHDVREALARNSEIADIKAEDAVATSYDTKARQDDVENRFDDQMAGNTDIDEVIDARRPEGEEAYPTLRKRLDEERQEVTAQLAQIALNTNNFDTYQDAVNTAQNTSGILMFPSGEHSLNNVHIDPTKPLTVLGSGVKNTVITSETTVFNIVQEDSESVGNATVTSDIPYGSKVLNVDNTVGMKKGQLVFVKSSQDMEETAVDSKKQYTSFIEEVTSNQIVLTDKAPQTFGEGFEINVLTFNHSPIVFNDLTVESKRDFRDDGGTKCFYLKNVADFTLNNVLMKDRDESTERNPSFDGSTPLLNGVVALQSKKIRVNDVDMFYLVYGILCHDGTSDVIITNPYTYYCRHTNNFGKGAYDLKIQGGKAYACFAGFDAHDTTIDVELVDCFSTGGLIATRLRARKKVVRNSVFEDGLWATINNSVLDEIPFESSEGSTLGVWLYNTNITDPDNRRALLDGYTTFVDGGVWENVTTSTTASATRKKLIVKNLNYFGENNNINTDPAVFVDAEINIIKNCHVLGSSHGVVSTDDERANKMFFYHHKNVESKVTFEGNVIDGFRSGYYLNNTGDHYNVNINNNKIINSGGAVRVVPSGSTFIASMENNVFEGNYEDFDKERLFKSDTPTNALPLGLEINSRNTTPETKNGVAKIFIHSADNQLKIQLDDGTIKTIVVE